MFIVVGVRKYTMTDQIEQGEVQDISVENLDENPWNPNEMPEDIFDKLKDEYDRIGYLQPVLVRPVGEDGEERYEIVDGEHRWRAARQKGLDTIKCVVQDMSDEDARITTMNMNDVKGSDNPIQLAELLDSLEEEGKTTEELDELLLMSEGEIEKHKMLIDAPDEEDVMEELEGDEEGESTIEFEEILLELKPELVEDLQSFFDCNRQELETEIKTYLENEVVA